MAIPRKLWSRLTDSLLDFRNHPSEKANRWLLDDETECGWPWNASPEQLQEWQDICNRTRATFETEVSALRAA